MPIVLTCGALLLAGLVAGVAWGGQPFATPDATVDLTPSEVARRYAWYASLALTAGMVAGIAVIGAGGRLVMRLLAVTAGDDAQGRITEAEEVVGRITVDGTIGFVLFNGIFGGVAAAALYLLVRRFLPAGRIGGVLFGLGLLVVLGSVIDPLRSDNPDFGIVGPGWLAALAFSALAIGFGTALHGVVARLSTWLPLPSARRGVILRYALPVALAAITVVVPAAFIVIGIVVVVVTRWTPVVDAVRSHRWLVGGRALVIGLVVLSLPKTLRNVADIVGS